MRVNLNVDVHHISRVEGHGNIVIRVKNGLVEEARWDVVETPRYFEVMLKGKHFSSAGILTARICGICSIGHCLASVCATEDAFGIEIPPLAEKLRLLAKHGETLQSHILHLVFLAAPDFLELPSAIPLMTANPEAFQLSARLKGLSNRLCDVVAGRTTHPVSIHVGGMAKVPDKKVLAGLRTELESALGDLQKLSALFATFSIPSFERETEYVSLKGDNAYPWIGSNIISTDGVEKGKSEYRALTNEYVTDRNTSKWCKLSRASFAVGALARYNNNYNLLHEDARGLAADLGLLPVCHNPFMFNAAQLVECVHVTHDAIGLIDEILDTTGNLEVRIPVDPKSGKGTSAVEVPRGILYHHYEYDDEGRIVSADCVIPTTQNNANIHFDIQNLVKEYTLRGTTDKELEHLSSMLVRAYDPCISCSVH
ncbi:MAG: Ni/Fe hydrogenase subunit alpha [Proteobacteria bacterium]|nr:Ni/Fe hydrogenase subunit alpha [Pseudomonadota bacterium]